MNPEGVKRSCQLVFRPYLRGSFKKSLSKRHPMNPPRRMAKVHSDFPAKNSNHWNSCRTIAGVSVELISWDLGGCSQGQDNKYNRFNAPILIQVVQADSVVHQNHCE